MTPPYQIKDMSTVCKTTVMCCTVVLFERERCQLRKQHSLMLLENRVFWKKCLRKNEVNASCGVRVEVFHDGW
jgi:hypothetical protein